jgi:hypothetical protein
MTIYRLRRQIDHHHIFNLFFGSDFTQLYINAYFMIWKNFSKSCSVHSDVCFSIFEYKNNTALIKQSKEIILN